MMIKKNSRQLYHVWFLTRVLVRNQMQEETNEADEDKLWSGKKVTLAIKSKQLDLQ